MANLPPRKRMPLERKPRKRKPRTPGLPRAAWAAVMRAAARRFPPGNKYGVVAFGIRRTRSKGLAANGFGLTVYVLRKTHFPPHPVPSLSLSHAGSRLRVVPDIVGTGAAPRASGGTNASFTGLHPGAAIRVPATGELASVGCLLGSAAGPRFLLTAGHVFAEGGDAGEAVWAAPTPEEKPSCVGHLVANLLETRDRRRLGLDAPIDVALVELTDDGVAMANATRPRFSPGGIMRSSAADDGPAQVFSWLSGDFSAEAQVTTLPTAVHFDSAARGFYTVSGVLGTHPCITEFGDSGTALLSADADRLLIGLCVGAYRVQSIFEPLDRALGALRTTFSPLQGWNNPPEDPS